MLAKAVVRLLPRNVFASGHAVSRGGYARLWADGKWTTFAGRDDDAFPGPIHDAEPRISTCGEHIEEGLPRGAIVGTRRGGSGGGGQRRLAEVGIADPDVVHRYPFQLSGGMRQRVALASALARDPELLITDEPTTALDVTTQAEILELLASIQSRGMGLVLITHDLRIAFSVCERIYVLYAGSLVEMAPAVDASGAAAAPLLSRSHAFRASRCGPRQATLTGHPGLRAAPSEVSGGCARSPPVVAGRLKRAGRPAPRSSNGGPGRVLGVRPCRRDCAARWPGMRIP